LKHGNGRVVGSGAGVGGAIVGIQSIGEGVNYMRKLDSVSDDVALCESSTGVWFAGFFIAFSVSWPDAVTTITSPRV